MPRQTLRINSHPCCHAGHCVIFARNTHLIGRIGYNAILISLRPDIRRRTIRCSGCVDIFAHIPFKITVHTGHQSHKRKRYP